MPRKSVVMGVFSTRPTELNNAMRSDTERETQIIRSQMSDISLTTAYDLCLLSASDGQILPNRLYVEIETNRIIYTVRNLTDLITRGEIFFESLNITHTPPVTVDELRIYLPKILEITSARGDTKIETAPIGDWTSWGISMGASAVAGGVTGLSGVGLLTLFGEYELGMGTGYALAASWGFPIAIGAVLSTLIIAGVGKTYAVSYETAINKASMLLSEGKYSDAIKALDEEFNRIELTKAVRWLYLSRLHYALAHFFRGACAEARNNKIDAYIHYEMAIQHAVEAKNPLMVLIAKMLLLKLLKNNTAEYLPSTIINREEKMKEILE